MNRSMIQVLAAAALSATAFGAAAQKPIVYPAKGQSAQQQKKDDGECYVWAKNSTGIDPAALAAAPPPPPPPAGGALKGAARGAVVGEVVNDNPGGGAAAGAVVGAARAKKKAEAQQQQQTQAKQQSINTYYRAFGACMEGRGYTIK